MKKTTLIAGYNAIKVVLLDTVRFDMATQVSGEMKRRLISVIFPPRKYLMVIT